MLRDKLYKGRRMKNTCIIFIVIILIVNLFDVQVYADEKVIGEIKDILNQYYIEDISQDILNKNSANDIINDLNDPYTQIMNSDEYNSYLGHTFSGIGIRIKMTQDGATVDSVMVNSPAMESGIKEGDMIIAVDDNFINGLSVNDALKILNGKPNIRNELKIIRKNSLITISIVPGTVYYPTIYSKIIDNHIAYMCIMSFGENTLSEFKNIVDSLINKTVDSFIIDLRNNPGGYIQSAFGLAGYFVGNNTFAIAKNKNGIEFRLNSVSNEKVIDKPTIFLVNKNTASASEMLAACVQDHVKAIIIGEPTYGKGVAQSIFKLSDGSILKATTLKFYSPKGRDINSVGISPDIHIKDVYSLMVGELLARNVNRLGGNGETSKVVINNKNYYLDVGEIRTRDYWEAYRQIISQATSIDVSSYSQLNQSNKAKIYPIIKYAEVPKTEYKLGDRVSFKLNSPNYNGLVQYRAMLLDESTNQYINLWNTKDFYYDKWKPRGKDVFTITFPVSKAGNYRIKFFVKRSGIANAKTALKGMNCDSYVYELPFRVVGM